LRNKNKDLSSSFLAERMEIEKDPSGTDEHTQAVSDQNPVAEVQNRGSFMQ
jgi:hypothetical protein